MYLSCTITTTAASTLYASDCSPPEKAAPLPSVRTRNAIPQEKDMGAYLMVFHKDETHSLYMAVSDDGYTFTALNDGKPVIAGDAVALQKGIRDPHIFRGPDGVPPDRPARLYRQAAS